MPSKDGHLQFQQWAREYGDVYSLMLSTKTTIVLSSDKAIKDLLDKRGDIYSSRPDLYLGQKLCSGDLRVLMMASIRHAVDNVFLKKNSNMAQLGAWYERLSDFATERYANRR